MCEFENIRNIITTCVPFRGSLTKNKWLLSDLGEGIIYKETYNLLKRMHGPYFITVLECIRQHHVILAVLLVRCWRKKRKNWSVNRTFFLFCGTKKRALSNLVKFLQVKKNILCASQ